jgi:signal transduction histidine kinase
LIYFVLIAVTCFLVGNNYAIKFFLGKLLLIIELGNFFFLMFVPLWFYFKTRYHGALAFSVSYSAVGVSLLYSTFSFLMPGLKYYLVVDLLTVGLFVEMLLLSAYMIYSYKNMLKHKTNTENELQIERIKNQQAFIQGQEEEKKALALFLHDHVASQLTITLNQLKANFDIQTSQTSYEALIFNAETGIRQANADIRSLSHQLLPVALDTLPITDAVHQLLLENNTSFKPIFLAHDIPEKLSVSVTLNIYRIMQELLKNAVTHAQASEVFVQLIGHPGHIELHYEDDGKGFNKNDLKKGIGFRSMEFRAHLMNATFSVESQQGKGVLVSMRIPI